MIKILVHGGAGTVKGEERRKLAADGVIKAAEVGYDILQSDQSALDAVQEAVKIMEDLPQYNAGLGSVMTEERSIEMDALLVDGNSGNMGGVMTVSRVKNPILLSRLILDNSKHLLFSAKGAEKFAEKHGLTLINPNELITDKVRQRYEKYLQQQDIDESDPEGRDKYGTVGAVAIDSNGYLASATSTGGILGKIPGRIGDTPIFGAGTYADQSIAISATGVGEYIIQGMLAMKIKFMSESIDLKTATEYALNEVTEKYGPSGVICMDSDGNWVAKKTTKDLIYAFKDEYQTNNFLSESYL